MAEILPGSVSTFYKWFDGWTFCILENFFYYLKALSVIVISNGLKENVKY